MVTLLAAAIVRPRRTDAFESRSEGAPLADFVYTPGSNQESDELRDDGAI